MNLRVSGRNVLFSGLRTMEHWSVSESSNTTEHITSSKTQEDNTTNEWDNKGENCKLKNSLLRYVHLHTRNKSLEGVFNSGLFKKD
jgi:hypothetical protein